MNCILILQRQQKGADYLNKGADYLVYDVSIGMSDKSNLIQKYNLRQLSTTSMRKNLDVAYTLFFIRIPHFLPCLKTLKFF